MPKRGLYAGEEGLPAITGADMDANEFTALDLLDELAAQLPAPRQPGDIDAHQLAERCGFGENRARLFMHEMAKDARYKLLWVYDPEIKRRIQVIRRAQA